MKRIAIFTTDLYQGGVAESTRKILRMLAANYSVDVIVYDTAPISVPIDSRVRILKIGAPLSVNFAGGPIRRQLKRYLRPIGVIYASLYLIAYKLTQRPTHVYSLTYIPNIVNIITKIVCRGTKVIVSERQDPRMDLRTSRTFARLLKKIYPLCDILHVNSEGMEEAVKQFYDIDYQRIARVDNFFDFEEIEKLSTAPLPLETRDIFSKPVVISSGRLSKQKGHWHLIKAFSHLKAIHADVQLVLLGDGELRAELESLVGSLELTESVHFLGNVTNPHRFVARSTVFVFPSIWESFGNSLLEAMAVGTPVISSSCPSGPGEIINHGCYGVDIGILPDYECDSAQHCESAQMKLANAMRAVVSNSAYREQLAAKAKEGSCRFGIKSARPKLLALFEQN